MVWGWGKEGGKFPFPPLQMKPLSCHDVFLFPLQYTSNLGDFVPEEEINCQYITKVIGVIPIRFSVHNSACVQ